MDIKPEDLQPATEKLGIEPKHVKHYAQALAKWAAAGFPTRTEGEVKACLAMCKACEHYMSNGRCRRCGCCINKSKVAVLNKAKMKTEQCPVSKW